jgi:hypothetical protein
MCCQIKLRMFCLSIAISVGKRKILLLVVILGFPYENHIDGYLYNFNWVHYGIRIQEWIHDYYLSTNREYDSSTTKAHYHDITSSD